MRFVMRSLSGLGLFAVTLALLGLAGLFVLRAIEARGAEGGSGGRPPAERVVAAEVLPLTPGRIAPEIVAYGEVRARRTLELRAPRAGTVVWLAPGLADGAAVAEGDVLVRLDPAEAEEALALARAALTEAADGQREAEANLALARDDLGAAEAQAALRQTALARAQDLAARGLGSEAAVETAALAASSAGQAVLGARRALAQAEAGLAGAAVTLTRARIGEAEALRGLAETELVAGLAGRLDGVALAVGARVSAQEVVGRIVDPAALEVAFRLSAAQYDRIVGPDGALLPLAVRVGGGAGAVPAAIERSAPAVGEGQAGRLVYAGLGAQGTLRPGDFVEVTVVEPELDGVVLLPASALGPGDRLLVLGEGERLEEVVVEVVRRQGDSVILRPGARAGGEAVAVRGPLVGAGIRVRPVRPGAEAAAPDTAPDTDIALTDERRAALIAAVEGNGRMPDEAKARVLEQLRQERVPLRVIERIEARTGGG
jgi:multidrug efflux pump subunit AcrA (membrane-fusion protein)